MKIPSAMIFYKMDMCITPLSQMVLVIKLCVYLWYLPSFSFLKKLRRVFTIFLDITFNSSQRANLFKRTHHISYIWKHHESLKYAREISRHKGRIFHDECKINLLPFTKWYLLKQQRGAIANTGTSCKIRAWMKNFIKVFSVCS